MLLQEGFKIKDEDLETDFRVRTEIIREDDDPDWVVETEDDRNAFEQAQQELERGDVYTLEEVKKERGYA